MITNDARCTCEIKPKITKEKAAFNKKKTLFTNKIDLSLGKTSEMLNVEHGFV
jgi:hypothetical protein